MHKTSTTGKLGEGIAVRYLTNKGYKVVETNYRKPWGEIDIVAKKDGALTFVEVKAKHKSSFPVLPEDHVGERKKTRLKRAIETYLNERKFPASLPFQVDVLAIELDFERKRAKIRHIKNIEFN